MAEDKEQYKKSIRFFNDREVRAVWDEEQNCWWFSATDIVRAINNDPDYTKAGNYWRWLKRMLYCWQRTTPTIVLMTFLIGLPTATTPLMDRARRKPTNSLKVESCRRQNLVVSSVCNRYTLKKEVEADLFLQTVFGEWPAGRKRISPRTTLYSLKIYWS